MLPKRTEPAIARRVARRWRGRNRRGIYTLWTILILPAFLLLFILLVDIAQLWLARVELENALEAAALAAVKEWGDANGGSTLVPREIGVEYAAANTINGVPVVIDTNYNPEHPPNENDTCDGNLVFGAIIEEQGDPCPRYIFNAGIRPSCLAGTILFDVTGQGKAGLEADNAWGVAFIRTEDTPENLRVRTIIYDLTAGGGDGVFISAPVLSSNAPGQWIVRDLSGGNSQPDIEGFTNLDVFGASGQIQFFLDTPWRLRVEFFPDNGFDAGFEPCDRFRFGIRVDGVADEPGVPGKYKNDADGIGHDRVGVTVIFEQGPVGSAVALPPVSAHFINKTNVGCRDVADTWDLCHVPPLRSALIVAELTPGDLGGVPPEFSGGIPNLPCPAASAPDNNGQSWVMLSGDGYDYGVRAQATVSIDSLLCRLCGISFGPFNVSACTTAMYDCDDRRPRLIRVEREDFICPGP